MKDLNKLERKVLRAIKSCDAQIPYHADRFYNALIEAADILSVKELVEMIKDGGY